MACRKARIREQNRISQQTEVVKYEAAKIAADYTVQCIKNTIDDDSHWYGVKFETAFSNLINDLSL